MTGTEMPTLAKLEKLVEQAIVEVKQARDDLTCANFKFAAAKVEFQHAEAARDLAKRNFDVAEAKAVAARLDYVAATLEHDQHRTSSR